MINYIWMFLTIIGLIFAMVNGTVEEVNKAIFEGAKAAVTLCFGLISVLVFWLGIMNIARESGLLDKLSVLFRPLITRLFPDVPPHHPALGYILSNMMANMFGLGNAATPLGIKAMKELQKLNGKKDTASRSMITFLAINTASLTLIPTTVLAIRMNYDSAQPAEIVVPTLIASFISLLSAIAIDRWFYYRRLRRKR